MTQIWMEETYQEACVVIGRNFMALYYSLIEDNIQLQFWIQIINFP